MGPAHELRACDRQDEGLDTMNAKRGREAPGDTRRYDAAAAILRDLGVRSIRLLTNDTAKLEALRRLGVRVELQTSSVG